MSVASSCLLPRPPPLLLLNCDSRSTVFAAGPRPRPSTPSVPCRTSTTTIHAQCSLPDLNHDQPRPVFPAGTSTTTIPRPVFPAGPQPRVSTPSVPCRTSCRKIKCQIECQKICQVECQKICQIDMPERYARRYVRIYAR